MLQEIRFYFFISPLGSRRIRYPKSIGVRQFNFQSDQLNILFWKPLPIKRKKQGILTFKKLVYFND